MGRTLDSDASAQDHDMFGAAFTAPRSPGFLVEPRRGFNSTRLMKTETGTGASLSRSGGVKVGSVGQEIGLVLPEGNNLLIEVTNQSGTSSRQSVLAKWVEVDA